MQSNRALGQGGVEMVGASGLRASQIGVAKVSTMAV
jgi:hypothetical protein